MTYRKLLPYAFAAVAALGLVSAPLTATASDRLTDKEVSDLLDRIEHNRSEFEDALDDKVKNSIISTNRGQVNANEFFDDLEDQVERTRDRFKSEYSASTEVLALLDYATRLGVWVTAQPPGFSGSQEWAVLAADFRRLAAAYNTTIPVPPLGRARRFNDDELVTAAANVETLLDDFRTAYDSTLVGTSGLTDERRLTAIGSVDAMKTHARELNAALKNDQKGIAEADALLKQGLLTIDAMSKIKLNQATTAAWTPLRQELAKVAWAYEVNNANLPLEVNR